MKTFLTALKIMIALTILTGIVYPLAMLGLGKLLFSDEASGSLRYGDGKLIGSELIGQKFTEARYFWSRPSAIDYNPLPSSGTNWGPTSKALLEKVTERRQMLTEAHFGKQPPDELLLASSSGLDPHISPEAAYYQVDRIVQARHLTGEQIAQLRSLIAERAEQPSLGFIGEPRVNVLKLNLAVDSLFPVQGP